MKNTANVTNSAQRVLNILLKLNQKNCKKTDLLDNFSDDTLLSYIHTLEALGCKITLPKRNYPYYELQENFSFFSLNNEDISFLYKLKNFLSQVGTYTDIINFNILLTLLANYTDINTKKELYCIIDSKPFGNSLHGQLLNLEKYIADKQSILIKYISPNSDSNYFKVLPKYIQLKSKKVYLWCIDNERLEYRYLRIDRIENIMPINEIINDNISHNYVICEIYDTDLLKNANNDYFEIINKNSEKALVKFYCNNSFELMQKILSFGKSCRVLEPLEFKESVRNTVVAIKEIYEKQC